METNKWNCSVFAVGESFHSSIFKLAFHYAETGIRVWVISPLPFSKSTAGLVVPIREVLQLVTFIYLKDQKDLVKQLNEIHLWKHTPSVIIIDHFDAYLKLNQTDYSLQVAVGVVVTMLASLDVCSNKTERNCLAVAICDETKVQTCRKDVQTIIDLYFNHFVQKTNDDDTFIEFVVNLYK